MNPIRWCSIPRAPCSSASRSPANAPIFRLSRTSEYDGAVRQSVIANLGRADELAASGALASLLATGAKLTDQVLLINALDEDADRGAVGLGKAHWRAVAV